MGYRGFLVHNPSAFISASIKLSMYVVSPAQHIYMYTKHNIVLYNSLLKSGYVSFDS